MTNNQLKRERVRPKKQWFRPLLVIFICVWGAVALIASAEDARIYLPLIVDDREGDPIQTITYVVTDDVFPNPERGFFDQQAPLWTGTEANIPYMDELRADNVTLMRLYFVIDEFREAPISAEALEVVAQTFDAAREAGVKVIPRFAYNFPSGDYENAQDATLERILAHLDQLEPLLTEHSDVIAYMNLGFVGAWGEWHSSSNNHVESNPRGINDNSRAIVAKILEVLPENRMALMRYPILKQELYGLTPLTANQAFSGQPQARIGALNDCFLASKTDWGTYTPYDTDADIEAYKVYLSADNLYVPQSGETCNAGEDAQPYIGCDTAVATLERMRWSGLHNGYLEDVLNLWQSQGCYDEIERRLGYRLWLSEAQFPTTAVAGQSITFKLAVQNDGFAPPYNPRAVELILRHQTTDEVFVLPLAIEPRLWQPGQVTEETAVVNLPNDLPPGDYQLLLNLPDPEETLHERPEYSIRLAHEGTWEADTGYNDLLATLVIEE